MIKKFDVTECEFCGSEVAEPWLEQHRNEFCSEVPEHRDTSDETDENMVRNKYIPEVESSPLYVYVILVVSMEQPFFYVGMTKNLVQRITAHAMCYEKIAFPADGEIQKCDYNLVGVNKVISVENEKRARYIEREEFIALASRIGSDMVCGGS